MIGKPTVDPQEAETTITFLETKWNRYDEAYNNYEAAMLEEDGKEEDIEKAQVEYYQLRSTCQHNIGKLRTLLTANKTPTVTPTSVVKPKLPSIQLPTFSGDPTEYEAFMDQYMAQIGNREDLEPVTKLQYLKSQLKGRALDLVQGYSSTSANYQSALDIL